MKKYRVLINGRNFILDMEGDTRPAGFYTTRFVEAANPEDAELAAVDAVRQDEDLRARVRNPPDDPPMLYAEEIEEVGALVEARGFTFY
jgi:hypothetical protein